MSYVTNAILFSDFAGSTFLDEVNRYFQDMEDAPEGFRGLVSVRDESLPNHWYGGSKGLECELAIGALNHFDIERFVAYVRALIEREGLKYTTVQLMVLQQDDTTFRLIDIFNGTPTE